jgi:hypothetical protein
LDATHLVTLAGIEPLPLIYTEVDHE